jgi:hypothetical protein
VGKAYRDGVTSDSRTAVIVALYQADRSDNANTGNAAMAVVGGAANPAR